MPLDWTKTRNYLTLSDMVTKLYAKEDVHETLQKFIATKFHKKILDLLKIEDAVLSLVEYPDTKNLVEAALLKIKNTEDRKLFAPLCDNVIKSKEPIPEHFLSSKRTAPMKFTPKSKNIIVQSEPSLAQLSIIKKSPPLTTTFSVLNPCKLSEMSIEQRNRVERLKRQAEEKKIGEAKRANTLNTLKKYREEQRQLAQAQKGKDIEPVQQKKNSNAKRYYKPY